MIKISVQALVAFAHLAVGTGCATAPSFAPGMRSGSEHVLRYAADVLIDGAVYTRSSTREVAGLCWNDKATGRLAYVAQTHVGEHEGVAVTVPSGRQGTRYVSCSWHTHPWGPHVAPGPSRQDLRSSMLPGARSMMHFVLDRHGIWQYSNGRVVEMCPWNSDGSAFDTPRCRS